MSKSSTNKASKMKPIGTLVLRQILKGWEYLSNLARKKVIKIRYPGASIGEKVVVEKKALIQVVDGGEMFLCENVHIKRGAIVKVDKKQP